MRLNNFNAIRVCRRLIAGILIPVLSIFISINASASETDAANDTTTKALKEFVVEAKKETHTDEGLMIYLSKENKRFGTNALDAISSLRQFTPTLNGESLTTASNKGVAIIINGVPSSAHDLRGYTGKEVKRITYYDQAPAQYSDITDGPLVEVEVEVKKDFISLSLAANNAVNTGFGNDRATIRWADSLNLVRADYIFDYRDLKFQGSDSYSFPSNPDYDRKYNMPYKLSGQFHLGQLSWQNIAHGNILKIYASFTSNNGRYNYVNNPEPPSGASNTESENGYTRRLHSLTNQGTFSAFFRKKLGKRRLDMQFNAGVGKTLSDNDISEMGSQQDDAYSTNVSSNTSNLYGKLSFYTPVAKNSLFLTSTYSWQRNSRKQTLPSFLKYPTTIQALNLSASMSRTFRFDGGKRFYYSVRAKGVYRNTYRELDALRIEGWNFSPSLSLSTLLSKNVFLRFYGEISSGNPTVGQLSETPTYQQENLAWVGNSRLRGWTKYLASIQPDIWPVSGVLGINGEIMFSYTRNPIMQCVFPGDPVEIRYVNIDRSRDVKALFYVNLIPTKWLSIKPYFQWTYSCFDTPSHKIRDGYFHYGGSIMANTEKWQGVVTLHSPGRGYSGDIMEYAGWQIQATALYKITADLTASLSWAHMFQNDKKVVSSPGVLNYTSYSHIPRAANMVSVGVTWWFSHGVYRKRTEPDLDSSTTDNGLTDYNEAKM